MNRNSCTILFELFQLLRNLVGFSHSWLFGDINSYSFSDKLFLLDLLLSILLLWWSELREIVLCCDFTLITEYDDESIVGQTKI